METLNTKQAAAFLHLHPNTLLDKVKNGEIPAAKLGKGWVFLVVDLINCIRSQYSQQASQGDSKGNQLCHSTNEKTRPTGGSKSQVQALSRYNALLAQPIEN